MSVAEIYKAVKEFHADAPKVDETIYENIHGIPVHEFTIQLKGVRGFFMSSQPEVEIEMARRAVAQFRAHFEKEAVK